MALKLKETVTKNIHKLLLKGCDVYLFVGTEGTQCLATSAAFPFKTRTDLKENNTHCMNLIQSSRRTKTKTQSWKEGFCTYPTGKGIAIEPVNSPAPTTFKFDPKTILHSLRNDTVQKGRTNSWLSM